MNITLRQIKAFLAVAELSSFNRAGRLLNISQSAVSSLIRELETQVGMSLFDRTSRVVSLSAEGASFLPVVRRANEELDQVEYFAQELNKQRSGLVTIAGAPMVCCSVLPAAVAAFAKTSPGIRVKIVDINMSHIQRLVIDGKVDFGVGPQWSSEPESVMELFFLTKVVLVVRPDHPLAGKEISWKHLKRESIIAGARDTLHHFTPDIMSSGDMRIIEEVNQMSTAYALAAAGRGVVFSSEYYMRLAIAFGLISIPIVKPELVQSLMIYTAKSRKLSSAARIFLDFLRGFVLLHDPNNIDTKWLIDTFE